MAITRGLRRVELDPTHDLLIPNPTWSENTSLEIDPRVKLVGTTLNPNYAYMSVCILSQAKPYALNHPTP